MQANAGKSRGRSGYKSFLNALLEFGLVAMRSSETRKGMEDSTYDILSPLDSWKQVFVHD